MAGETTITVVGNLTTDRNCVSPLGCRSSQLHRRINPRR